MILVKDPGWGEVKLPLVSKAIKVRKPHMNASRKLCIKIEIFDTRYEKFKYLNKYITIHNILRLHVT